MLKTPNGTIILKKLQRFAGFHQYSSVLLWYFDAGSFISVFITYLDISHLKETFCAFMNLVT